METEYEYVNFVLYFSLTIIFNYFLLRPFFLRYGRLEYLKIFHKITIISSILAIICNLI